MKATILIPTYEQAHLLGEAIASALAQRHEDLEVVVADDGSGNRTLEVAASFAEDRRLRYVRSNAPRGRARNCRRAFSEASGEWILVLEGRVMSSGELTRTSSRATAPRRARCSRT